MYKIISDSSCDLTKKEIVEMNIEYVPFIIEVDGVEYKDDNNLNIEGYLGKMENSKNPIKTACPSPYDYLNVIERNLDKDIYILTISSKLSGSYNSAKVAEKEAKEKHPDIKIHVIDSKSASAGQTRIALKMLEVLKENDFDSTIKIIEEFVDNQKTMFVLESLQNLIKNGRIKKTTGLLANVLNIRPIMIANNGEIEPYEISRGTKKSLDKMAKAIGSLKNEKDLDIVTISYVRNKERAEKLGENIKELYKNVKVHIRHTNGLSSGYADLGGIVIAY
ncbi:DegV family protein [Peptoniphilus sp. MSJ-1]|uniref:DegV family protein n=1 Tax=Peptoniphilus ovalis TaxID=2841503 RepID=A0ABS6FGX3_9FIRM|nr:DegV family protein [Peptoniphilus ovalis]MBU5669427.1 DegV family protein [Peptoniphilus ovalis]